MTTESTSIPEVGSTPPIRKKRVFRWVMAICGLLIVLVGGYAIYRWFLKSEIVRESGNEVHKFVFLRENNLFLTDTTGKNPEQLTSLGSDRTVKRAKISDDEKYLAYTVTDGGTDRAEFELDLMDLQTGQTQKIFDSKNADRLGGILDFSSEDLLAYSISPGYMDKINTMGTPDYPDPSTLVNVRVVDNTGKELNKIIDYENGLWIGKDLIFVKPRRPSNLPPGAMIVWGGEQFTDFYISRGGREQPQKIGEVGREKFGTDARIFAKDPSELVWKTGSHNNPGNLGFAPMDYYSFDINTKGVSQISLPERNPAKFSDDMKYYTQVSILVPTPKQGTVPSPATIKTYIKSVDKSVNTDISELQSTGNAWLSHQLLCSTPQGLKVTDLGGQITNITENPKDRIIY